MSKRPYKSTALRALEGGRSNSLPKPETALESEPKFIPTIPKPPPHLDTQAKKTYKKLAALFERAGMGTAADADALAALSQIQSRLVALQKEIKTSGGPIQTIHRTRTGKDGVVETTEIRQAHPLLVVERQYFDKFLVYAKQFGLTPVARVGLTINSRDDNGVDYTR